MCWGEISSQIHEIEQLIKIQEEMIEKNKEIKKRLEQNLKTLKESKPRRVPLTPVTGFN